MAAVTIKGGDDYALKLAKLGENAESIVKKALFEAGKIVADRVRANLDALPEDDRRLPGRDYYYLTDSQVFNGVPPWQKSDLQNSLGITPIGIDKNGFYNIKIGFDGYGSQATMKYPNGIPNQLLARSVESGSSVRAKTPFVAPAIKATRKAAVEAMQKVVEEETEKQ